MNESGYTLEQTINNIYAKDKNTGYKIMEYLERRKTRGQIELYTDPPSDFQVNVEDPHRCRYGKSTFLVLSLLNTKKEPITAIDIAAELGLNEKSCASTLNRLTKVGCLERKRLKRDPDQPGTRARYGYWISELGVERLVELEAKNAL